VIWGYRPGFSRPYDSILIGTVRTPAPKMLQPFIMASSMTLLNILGRTLDSDFHRNGVIFQFKHLLLKHKQTLCFYDELFGSSDDS